MAPSKKLNVALVIEALALLKERGGSRFKDIQKVLSNGKRNPTFFELITVLHRGRKDGVLRQKPDGRWMVNFGKSKRAGPAKLSPATYRS